MDLAEVVAVQAEGNYVSLRHRPNPYLLHESLSSMAGEAQALTVLSASTARSSLIFRPWRRFNLATGEYRLRVKGGKEYLVTRTYKDNLRNLAQLWVG